MEFNLPCVFMGLCLSQKNGCGAIFTAPQLICVLGGIIMKNKKLVIAAVALALVIALMAGLYLTTRPQAEEGDKQVTVVIVHKDGTEKKLEYTTDLQYLADLLLEKELATGYTSEEYGFTVESVDGVTADWSADSAYWALYEGDTYATTSASGIVLTDGGVYKLVYETF